MFFNIKDITNGGSSKYDTDSSTYKEVATYFVQVEVSAFKDLGSTRGNCYRAVLVMNSSKEVIFQKTRKVPQSTASCNRSGPLQINFPDVENLDFKSWRERV